jgi:membrane-associated protein
MHELLDIVLHLDTHLAAWTTAMGPSVYVLLFGIIFAETGLVVTPFLPGDSLLFATGAICAVDGSPLNVGVVLALMVAAAVLGDATNYAIGYRVGPKVFKSETSWWLNKKHLLRAQAFYERHGGKTIVLARFMPIIRTFAPFVAGIGKMQYRRFAVFNISGGAAWVTSFLLAGFWFGNLPWVKKQFHVVIVVIIILSVLPGIIEYFRGRKSELDRKDSENEPA